MKEKRFERQVHRSAHGGATITDDDYPMSWFEQLRVFRLLPLSTPTLTTAEINAINDTFLIQQEEIYDALVFDADAKVGYVVDTQKSRMKKKKRKRKDANFPMDSKAKLDDLVFCRAL